MAVQQNKQAKSKRGKRRSHDFLSVNCIATDKNTGEAHLRHHISPNGNYRGKRIKTD